MQSFLLMIMGSLFAIHQCNATSEPPTVVPSCSTCTSKSSHTGGLSTVWLIVIISVVFAVIWFFLTCGVICCCRCLKRIRSQKYTTDIDTTTQEDIVPRDVNAEENRVAEEEEAANEDDPTYTELRAWKEADSEYAELKTVRDAQSNYQSLVAR
ncbi:uncharacterized protein LOC114543206 [Dendronephthya gigantea]|uniref:uncharacterized protein LOC114543206 n=1 Tax=Dendronephthya gigantea TaxID=151771 RepID=UPI00106D580C|nr:uncharacterized protein LOC114543206 [Dendronephthya gigantea]